VTVVVEEASWSVVVRVSVELASCTVVVELASWAVEYGFVTVVVEYASWSVVVESSVVV
jgi:hypothetical protein